MTVTEQIFVKTHTCTTLFLKKSHTEFHENPSNGLIGDTKSQTDVAGLRLKRSVILRRKTPNKYV